MSADVSQVLAGAPAEESWSLAPGCNRCAPPRLVSVPAPVLPSHCCRGMARTNLQRLQNKPTGGSVTSGEWAIWGMN